MLDESTILRSRAPQAAHKTAGRSTSFLARYFLTPPHINPIATRPYRQLMLTLSDLGDYRGVVDIEASARKHGVPDEDMLHALRHHWRAFETDDPAVTMFIGPSRNAEPLEVGVVTDEEGTAVIHAMKAREKFLKGWWKI